MTTTDGAAEWAEEEFGDADLGDRRRAARLVNMGAQVFSKPAGTVSQIFTTDRGRDGAYDLLENNAFDYTAILAPHYRSTAKRIAALGDPYAFVAVDGSSLTFTDREKAKGFGPIGARKYGAQGVKTLAALALDSEGTVVGLLGLDLWVRSKKAKKAVRKRTTAQKETQRWVDIIRLANERIAPTSVDPWFVVDREGDSAALLLALDDLNVAFTVRSNHDRMILSDDGKLVRIRTWLDGLAVNHVYEVEVTGRPKRHARTARMAVSAGTVTVPLRDPDTHVVSNVVLNVVRAVEVGTTPDGEEVLEWILYTRSPIALDTDLAVIIESYIFRWRIEEWHRSWKSGRCKVESSQLRSKSAVTKWAALLATVATDVERIKRLARIHPKRLAMTEFSQHELEALVLAKCEGKKRPKNLEKYARSLTIGTVVLWIAELGGYTGKSSGGPPGAITIGRGLDYLRPLAEGYALARSQIK